MVGMKKGLLILLLVAIAIVGLDVLQTSNLTFRPGRVQSMEKAREDRAVRGRECAETEASTFKRCGMR